MKRPPKSQKTAMLAFVGLIVIMLAISIWRVVRPVDEVRWSGSFMGRPWTVIVQDRRLIEGLRTSFEANIPAMLAQLETRYLRADGIGLVAEFNASTSTVPAYVGIELWRVVNAAKRLSQSTPACDITLPALQDVWARVAAGQVRPLADTAVQAFLRDTGMERISAPAEGYIRKLRPEIKIDISSGAEGYAADRVEIMMLENKIENFHIQIGGTLLCRGQLAVSTSVPVTYGPGLKPVSTTHVNLAAAQMTTRGRGDGYIHIDPRTGRPVSNNVRSVSVISENGLMSANLATVLYILGPEAGLKWVEANSVAPGRALFHLDGPGGTTTIIHSKNFPFAAAPPP